MLSCAMWSRHRGNDIGSLNWHFLQIRKQRSKSLYQHGVPFALSQKRRFFKKGLIEHSLDDVRFNAISNGISFVCAYL